MVFPKKVTYTLDEISTLYYLHWLDLSAGGMLVLEGIIGPVVSTYLYV